MNTITHPPLSLFRFICCCTIAWLCNIGPASADISDTIQRIKPSIVAVGSFSRTASPQFNFRGTGFAVGNGRIIATNAHVVPEMLDQQAGTTVLAIQYRNAAGELAIRPATLLAKTPEHDLALLSIEGDALPTLELRNSDTVREGESIAFSGFPIGGALGYSTVTHRGVISAITPIALPGANSQQLKEKLVRRLRSGPFDVFQLDATCYPGNSGSPVFDPESGAVVGIINMVFIKGTREAALSQPSGISYALPANLLHELLRMSGK